jgi:tyrosinase
MAIEFLVNGSADPKARYVTWAASPCSIRLTAGNGLASPLAVTLRNKPSTSGGTVVFYANSGASASNSLSLTLTVGTPVSFLMGGKFGKPSTSDGDVTVQVMAGTKVLAEIPLMVRIRKNANALSASERDRFIAALAQLNNKGAGHYADFRNIHNQAGSPEAHSAPGFLPWHRAFLLDLERHLQAIDSSVALPYWRFDQKAPAVFTRDFFGSSNSLGTVQFSATNPLQFWVTDGVPGIKRRPLFNVATQPANNVFTETQTLALGDQFADFRNMEDNPHGFAHTSFGGSISSIPTAVKDPLFFLIHANVDRLWAKWQKKFTRYDSADAASFDSTTPPGGNRIGHNLDDTMWPWNGITGGQRPPTAPGGPMPDSVCASSPGPTPKVEDLLDYRGVVEADSRLEFDYDDVPFA